MSDAYTYMRTVTRACVRARRARVVRASCVHRACVLQGVGYFGGDAEQPDPVAVRWRSAGRQACLALKRKLGGAQTDEELAACVGDGEGVVAAAAAEALCREEPDLPPALAALLKPAQTAEALGLYAVILDERTGTFLAHGGSAELVGTTLTAVAARLQVPDGARLLQRFRAAAACPPEGTWVRYNWRSAPGQPLVAKGAHCRCVQLAHHPRRQALALLCYGASAASAPLADDELPTPPPVAPSRAAVRAAALALRHRLEAADKEADIRTAVDDADGVLATAAAVAIGWEVTPLSEASELESRLEGIQLQLAVEATRGA